MAADSMAPRGGGSYKYRGNPCCSSAVQHHQVCYMWATGSFLRVPHGSTASPLCSSSLNCSITNIKKSSVYSNTGSVSEHVGWIRRELLLKKASSGDISRVLPVLSELEGDDLERIVRWLPGSALVDGKSSFQILPFIMRDCCWFYGLQPRRSRNSTWLTGRRSFVRWPLI